jgi:transposase-like protein
MGKKRPRRNFTTEQKAAILRRHFLDRVPISELCEEYGLQPSVFHQWRQQLFENAPSALTRPSRAREKALERQVDRLEEKVVKKDEVIAWLTQEHVKLKKELGEP